MHHLLITQTLPGTCGLRNSASRVLCILTGLIQQAREVHTFRKRIGFSVLSSSFLQDEVLQKDLSLGLAQDNIYPAVGYPGCTRPRQVPEALLYAYGRQKIPTKTIWNTSRSQLRYGRRALTALTRVSPRMSQAQAQCSRPHVHRERVCQAQIFLSKSSWNFNRRTRGRIRDRIRHALCTREQEFSDFLVVIRTIRNLTVDYEQSNHAPTHLSAGWRIATTLDYHLSIGMILV